MAKPKTVFACGNCGARFPKWMGQCEKCGEWNTLSEIEAEPQKLGSTKTAGSLITFSEAGAKRAAPRARLASGYFEADRVLGGGFFADSLSLFVGNPGVGKSTLALQIALNIARQHSDSPVLVFSGEESAYQVLDRAERLGGVPPNLRVASAFAIDDVTATARSLRPSLVVVDSVQTFAADEVPNGPGTLPQIRAVTERLMHLAKTDGIPVLLIGQVTKGGEMAGPQLLAHLVDVVLQFEGDDQHDLRILRATKNRFGSTSEVGIFEMAGEGLREVKNPSAAFLAGRLSGAIGSTIYPALEGQRPFLVEIQALSAATPFGMPRRSASGIGLSRLALLLAVLEKHAGVKLAALDVFVNVVGGFSIDETAADLAVCLALASSRIKAPVPEDFLILGEVGLAGEVRAVSQLEKRLAEGEKLGFQTALVPAAQKKPKTGLRLIPVKTVEEAVRQAVR